MSQGYEPAERRRRVEQMAAVGVEMGYAAVETLHNPLGRLPSPPLKIRDAGHVEGVETLRNDPARKPLGEVAQRAAFQRGHGGEELLLDSDIQIEGEIDRPQHHARALIEAQVRLRGSDQARRRSARR